jgi:hypothetical protein
MAERCPKCGGTPIPGCDGRGYTFVGEDTVRPCLNILAKELKEHLLICGGERGSVLANTRHVKESPLFLAGPPGEPPQVDRTNEDLYITASTEKEALSHLKLALGSKGRNFSFSIITDEKIRTVFVGDTHAKVRGSSLSSDPKVFNSLEDLVTDPALLILMVGHLKYKNKAAAGALLEALVLREHAGKMTWIVHVSTKTWDHSYSEEVRKFLEANYGMIDLNSSETGPALPEVPASVDDDMTIEMHEPGESKPQQHQRHEWDDVEQGVNGPSKAESEDLMPLPGDAKKGRS